jgi:glutamate/tyrosine decarboxylase-like PLP-dependent enzyme
MERSDSEGPDSAAGTSLDPEDWEAFRTLAHAALDDAIRFLRTVRDRPVWQPTPENVKQALAEPLPVRPQGLASVYRDFLERVLPYGVGNVHPRFLGWVHGTGLASGVVAEMLAAAMNANCGGRDHSGLYVERAVIEWCKSLFGFPAGANGVLLTGTSMANLTGLAVARNARSGGEIRIRGVQGREKELVCYASAEAHESVRKAVELLGHGRESLRLIPVGDDFRIDLQALREAIVRDRADGREPFCVVGTAGTVNTGAIDDLDSLAAICREEGLWFHVDGAFGALAILVEALSPRLAGIERADSLAFDFHKWLHVPYDAGCLLVRDGERQRETFSVRADYLDRARRGLSGGGEWPADLGPELSRSFRALKIWFALKENGIERFGRAIEENCRLAEYLADLLRRTPGVELRSGPGLSIVCFRFRPHGWDGLAVDRLNADVVADLQESGVAAPSTTRLRGDLVIRVNITNHRTRREDLELLVREAAERAGRRIAARGSA